MKFPWKVKRQSNTPADQKLEQIKQLLFPPLELREEISSDGSVVKYHIDYSVDSNVDAVLMDLQDGQNDAIAHATLNKVVTRLNKARKLLEAYAVLSKEASYIIVDNGDNELDKILDED